MPASERMSWDLVAEGNDRGCLLLHGFSGSTLEMLPLGEALAASGWTVAAAQLAGHGSSPTDLARTTWHDWERSALQAYDELQRRCSRVAIVGLSMGGALGLYLAASAHPAAVVAISTPVRLRGLMARASRLASRVISFVPVLVKLGPRERDMQRYRSPYRRIPLQATQEVEHLLEAMRSALPQVRVPVLIVQGRRDWVIPPDSGPQIVALAHQTRARLLWLPRSGHVATLDRDRELLFTGVREFLRGHLNGDAPGEAGHGTAD